MTTAAEAPSYWTEERSTSPGFTLGPQAVVANDDPCLRHLIACLVAAEGVFVTEVENADALVTCATQSPLATKSYDLIVAELPMQGTRGFEVLQRIRDAGCQGPAIVIAVDIDAAASEEFHRLNAECLPKPFAHRDLRYLVSRLRSTTEVGERLSRCQR